MFNKKEKINKNRKAKIITTAVERIFDKQTRNTNKQNF